AGLQIAWFWLLAVLGGVAAVANVFISYLADIVPVLAEGWARGLTTAVLLGIPMVINCLGVRSGAALSSALAIGKLLPLGFLIVLGIGHAIAHPVLIHESDMSAPGGGAGSWRYWRCYSPTAAGKTPSFQAERSKSRDEFCPLPSLPGRALQVACTRF